LALACKSSLLLPQSRFIHEMSHSDKKYTIIRGEVSQNKYLISPSRAHSTSSICSSSSMSAASLLAYLPHAFFALRPWRLPISSTSTLVVSSWPSSPWAVIRRLCTSQVNTLIHVDESHPETLTARHGTNVNKSVHQIPRPT